MSVDTQVIPFTLGEPGAAGTLLLLEAPTVANGGGLTVLAAKGINNATTSGTATFTGRLVKMSSAGTPLLNGTVAALIGGTADHWTVGVPKAWTPAGTAVYLNPGEWLALDYAQVAGGTLTNFRGYVHAQLGR